VKNVDEPIEIVLHEWEEKALGEDLAEDREFLGKILSISDRRGRRIFDVMLKPGGKVVIKARGYVGVFTLKDGRGRDVVLVVEPKIGIQNLTWMMALCNARSFKELREIENLISVPAESRSIVDLLIISVIRKYLEKLSIALVYGFQETPRIEVEEGTVIRGRPLTSLMPRTLFSGLSPRIAYEYQNYTVDNPVNRYILVTGYILCLDAYPILKIIGKGRSEESTTCRIVHRALLELGFDLPLPLENANLRELLSVTTLDRPYINELLILATIIRRWLEKIQPPYFGELVEVPSLYINMNDLFENFARKILEIVASWTCRTKGLRLVVRKAGGNEKALVAIPRPGVFLKPDIVIETSGKPLAVGDVKYRLVRDPLRSGSKGDRNAVNQVYTYMHGWNVDKGLLIYPSIEGRTYCERYTLKDGKKLYVVKIYIDTAARTVKELRSSAMFDTLLNFLEEITTDV